MGSPLGAKKTAAIRLGVPWEEYQQRFSSGQRRCWDCKQWKPEHEFRVRRVGASQRQNHCSKCYRVYMRLWQQRHTQQKQRQRSPPDSPDE